MNKSQRAKTVFLDYEAPDGFHCEYFWDPKNNVFYEKHVEDEDVDVIIARETARLQAEADARAEEAAENPSAEDDEPQAEPEISENDPLAMLRKTVPIVCGRAAIEKLAAEPIPYVWGQVVVGGTINLFGGGPSSGKSTLLFILLAARSSLEPHPIEILTFPLVPAPTGRYIILIEGEHGERSTARKLLRSYGLIKAPLDGLDRVVVIARKAVTIGSPAWQRIKKLSAEGYVSDVFLDTLARVSPIDKEANDERAQIEVFEELARLIEVAPKEPTVWIAAHNRKSPAGGDRKKGDLEDVAGSAQRTGQVDAVVMVYGKKNEAREIDFSKLREEPDVYPEPIKYLIDREKGIQVLSSMSLKKDDFDASDKAVEEAFGGGLRGKLGVYMSDRPFLLFSFDALRRAMGSSPGGKADPASLRKVLQSYVKSGQITHTKEGEKELFSWTKIEMAEE